MKASILQRNSATICLVVVMVAYVALWLACPKKFGWADQWIYSERAFNIAHHNGFGHNDVFSHRLGATLPVALLYKLFGVNIITTTAWPLCAALLIILTVWVALPDSKSRVFGAVFCLTSVPLFKASATLLPDIIAAAFMAMSAAMLFSRTALIRNDRLWLCAPIASALCLFVAFLAKESAYWVLPLWPIALVGDLRGKDFPILFRRFYVPAMATGIILGLLYLLFCYVVWGDALARAKCIQALTGHHPWSWNRVSSGAFLSRMTISPVKMFLSQYGVVALLALFSLRSLPKSLVPWRYYAILCVVLFWFGSTSFTRYEPMPLTPRMALPAFPGLCVLAAFLSSRLMVASQRSLINRLIPLLILCLASLPFANYVYSWRGEPLAEEKAIAIVKHEVATHPDNNYLLICSDTNSPKSLAFYFGYEYPANLRVVFVGQLTRELLAHRKYFIFVDEDRSRYLKSEFGRPHYDDKIHSLGLPQLYHSNGFFLYESERDGDLNKLLTPDKRIDSGKD